MDESVTTPSLTWLGGARPENAIQTVYIHILKLVLKYFKSLQYKCVRSIVCAVTCFNALGVVGWTSLLVAGAVHPKLVF